MADFASTNGQILYVLRNSSGPMTSNQIYRAGSFNYEHTCYNGLAMLSKKGVLQRERVNGIFHYVVAPGADLSDWGDELKELAATGLPAPDPERRVGMPRAEYESKSREEKRTVKRTRSVIHRETAFVEEEVSSPAPEISVFQEQTVASVPAVVEPPAPAPAALPAPQPEQQPASILDELRAKRDALNREIAMAELLADLAGGGGQLAFMLVDYDELLELSIGCMDDQDAAPLVENQRKARAFAALLKEGDTSPFKRIAHQLLQWAFLNEDANAGCDDEGAKAARADADESRKLAAMLGVPSKPGEEPK